MYRSAAPAADRACAALSGTTPASSIRGGLRCGAAAIGDGAMRGTEAAKRTAKTTKRRIIVFLRFAQDGVFPKAVPQAVSGPLPLQHRPRSRAVNGGTAKPSSREHQPRRRGRPLTLFIVLHFCSAAATVATSVIGSPESCSCPRTGRREPAPIMPAGGVAHI